MRQLTGFTVIQVIIGHLFGTKLLPDLTYCQFDTNKRTSKTSKLKYKFNGAVNVCEMLSANCGSFSSGSKMLTQTTRMNHLLAGYRICHYQTREQARLMPHGRN